MDVVEVAKIKERIAELEKERDTLVQQANSQLTGYNAAISEMTKLLAPPSEESKGEQEVEAESG